MRQRSVVFAGHRVFSFNQATKISLSSFLRRLLHLQSQSEKRRMFQRNPPLPLPTLWTQQRRLVRAATLGPTPTQSTSPRLRPHPNLLWLVGLSGYLPSEDPTLTLPLRLAVAYWKLLLPCRRFKHPLPLRPCRPPLSRGRSQALQHLCPRPNLDSL